MKQIRSLFVETEVEGPQEGENREFCLMGRGLELQDDKCCGDG